jgi:hypothetical protein
MRVIHRLMHFRPTQREREHHPQRRRAVGVGAWSTRMSTRSRRRRRRTARPPAARHPDTDRPSRATIALRRATGGLRASTECMVPRMPVRGVAVKRDTGRHFCDPEVPPLAGRDRRASRRAAPAHGALLPMWPYNGRGSDPALPWPSLPAPPSARTPSPPNPAQGGMGMVNTAQHPRPLGAERR